MANYNFNDIKDYGVMLSFYEDKSVITVEELYEIFGNEYLERARQFALDRHSEEMSEKIQEINKKYCK